LIFLVCLLERMMYLELIERDYNLNNLDLHLQMNEKRLKFLKDLWKRA